MFRALEGCILRVAALMATGALRLIYRAYESENPTTVCDGIVIVGDLIFTNRARHAMRQLDLADYYGYRLVQRYLKSIVATEKPIGLGYLIGARFEPSATEGYIETDTARFAACLVRYAIYRRLLAGFGICVSRSRAAQRVALQRELRSMQLLNCNESDLERQLTFIRQRKRKRSQKFAVPL